MLEGKVRRQIKEVKDTDNIRPNKNPPAPRPPNLERPEPYKLIRSWFSTERVLNLNEYREQERMDIISYHLKRFPVDITGLERVLKTFDKLNPPYDSLSIR